MSSQAVELSLRGADGYRLARSAIDQMERRSVRLTLLNFELWLHVDADPGGALGREVDRLLSDGEEMTEAVGEALAMRFLPNHKVTAEIRQTGNELARQLEAIGRSIETAQKSNTAYSRTLGSALAEMEGEPDAVEIRRLVDHLSEATRRVQRENGTLERRLSDSTNEVRRLRQHRERTRRDAMTDALTGLANRKAFEDALEQACGDAEHPDLTLALVDIDHFKRFNDTWGHQTGDQVLRYVATILGRTGAAPRLAARYGGEEFALLFPHESRRQVETALTAMLSEVSSRTLKRRSTDEDLGSVTISAGFAQRRPNEPPGTLVERADTALYTSKHRGRNCVTSADAGAKPEPSVVDHPRGSSE